MNIVDILIGLLIGGGVGGGLSYFSQKGRISEAAQRYDQKYSQTRQALDEAEAELKEKKVQLSALSQSEERSKQELQNLETTYQSNLEQIERSYQLQMEENQPSVDVSPELTAELEKAKAQLLDYQGEIAAYQTQILELHQAISPSDDLEPAYQARIQEIEQHHQAYIEELQETYQRQLQEIASAHQAELLEQQQIHQTQFQEIEQAYQNQIVELEKTHQTQMRELEQAYQSQMLELQQSEPQLGTSVHLMSENPDEARLTPGPIESWDGDFAQATFLKSSLIEEENIAEISSLEELADLTSQALDEPEVEPPVRSRQQDEFFASQTLIGDMGFAESLPEMSEDPPVRSRQQDEFFASQTLIGDMGFAESRQFASEDSNLNSEEDLFQRSELDSSNPSDEFFHTQTMVGELDFLESLEFEDQNDDSPLELKGMTVVSEDFFVNEHPSNEDSFSDLLPTPEEMTADLKERFSLESNNPFEMEQAEDLDLFDSFETPEEINSNGSANGVSQHEFDAYHPDAALDFFNMLEKEHPETAESLEIDDKDINIDDLFSEDLFHSEWGSSPKN